MSSSEQIINETETLGQVQEQEQEAQQQEESMFTKLMTMTKNVAKKAQEKGAAAASALANSKAGKLTGNAAGHVASSAKGASEAEFKKHAQDIHDIFDHLRDVTRAAAEPGGMNGMCGNKEAYAVELKKALPDYSHEDILKYIEEHCSSPESAKITKKQKAIIMTQLYLAQKLLYGSYLGMGKVSAGISGMKKGISSAGKSLKEKFNKMRKKKSDPQETEMTGGIKSKENTMKGGFLDYLRKQSEKHTPQLTGHIDTIANMAAQAKDTAAAGVSLGKTAVGLGAATAYVGANVAGEVGKAVVGPHLEAARSSETGQKVAAAANTAAKVAKVGANNALAAAKYAETLYRKNEKLGNMSSEAIGEHVNKSEEVFNNLIAKIQRDMEEGAMDENEGNALIYSITAIHNTHMALAKSKMTKQKTAGGRKTKRHNKKKRARTRKVHKRRAHKRGKSKRKPKRKQTRRVNKKHKSRRNKKRARRNRTRRGGGIRDPIMPQSLVNFGRSIESGVMGIADSWMGKPLDASPYPTMDQYAGQNVKIIPSKPVNIKSIYAAAGNAAGSI